MTIKPNVPRLIELYSYNFLTIPFYVFGHWKLGLAINLFYTGFTGINQLLYVRCLKKEKKKDDIFKEAAIKNKNSYFEITESQYNELMSNGATTLKDGSVPLFKADVTIV